MKTFLFLFASLAFGQPGPGQFPLLCQDKIPGTGGFGNLHPCDPFSTVYQGSTLPSPLLGVDGDFYVYSSGLPGTISCWMGPKKSSEGGWTGCNPGLAGLQGPVGPAGPQGVKGATGSIGPQGPSGLNGSIGPQGQTGPVGPQGMKGDTGPVGPQGATGPAGPPGASGNGSGFNLVPCSTLALTTPGSVLVVTNAPVGTPASQIGQSQCLAGFRVVILSGPAQTATLDPRLEVQSPELASIMKGEVSGLDGLPLYAEWNYKNWGSIYGNKSADLGVPLTLYPAK